MPKGKFAMKNIILVANGGNDSLDYMRANAVMSVVARIESLRGQDFNFPYFKGAELLPIISSLRECGRLSFNKQQNAVTVQYIPSVDAKKTLLDSDVNKSWDEAIVKKQHKAIRTTSGAIFRLPLENGQGTIDTFITDWSPFPAATAITVHKDHPVVSLAKKEDTNYFTGLFVRHPLTGDLIPVFVAEWVKPEFGTGAVIVNPAHNQADLDFARSFGLPIRFGLVPHDVTSDPKTWPNAPVIKMGRSTKTGRFDNLVPEEAVVKYYDELHAFGHATKFTDIGVGAYPICELELSESGEFIYNTLTNELLLRADDGEYNSEISKFVNIIPSSILKGIVALDSKAEITIISQSSEIENALLFSRCLFYDLHGEGLTPVKVIQVQKVQEAKKIEETDSSVLLAMVVQSPNNQIAVLKQQALEQTARFVKNHNEIKSNFESATEENKEVKVEQYSKIKETIVKENYQIAFNNLYTIQKNLHQGISKAQMNMKAVKLYFALTYVLLGDDYPNSVSIADEWNSF